MNHVPWKGCFALTVWLVLLAGGVPAAEPRPAAGRDGFVDAFERDTRSDYAITCTTQVPADEYGNVPPADAVGVFYVAELPGLYVEARDDESVTLSRSIAGATSGVWRVTFTPLVLYPANGSLSLVAEASDGTPLYALTLAGGHYRTALTKSVPGYPVLSMETNGPHFATVDTIGADDGEGTTAWRIQEPPPCTVALALGPEGVEGRMNAAPALVVVDPSRRAPVVARLTLVVKQMECVLSRIEWAP
ncbi:MAG: hypothetical protein K8T26_17935 [Lentisphaerae bacterium]|nr:hypothetical protein [Lentisphaerota bacterium]